MCSHSERAFSVGCLAGAGSGGQDAVSPGGGLLAETAGIPVLIERLHDIAGVLPRVVVQGTAEHRAQGPPLQSDHRVGEGGVPRSDLPGQPVAEGGTCDAQGLFAGVPFMAVAAWVGGPPCGGEVAGQGRVDPVHAAADPVSSPTRAASSSTAVHSSRLIPANRAGAPSAEDKSVRRCASAMPWNRLTAGSSRAVCLPRWAME